MNIDPKKIGIIIPAFNEHENIVNLIKKIRKVISSKIIIIDDSSNNFTKNKINNSLEENIIYIQRKKKLGRGSAILHGLKNLCYREKNIEYFIEMDADLSHNPLELNKKIQIFMSRRLDLLISSRYMKNSKIKNWTLQRKILSKISNILANLIIKAPVTDYTNGYRMYSKKAALLILKKCINSRNDFILLSEIILILNINKLRISEKSTIFVNRIKGKSNVNFILIAKSFFGLINLFFIKKKFIQV